MILIGETANCLLFHSVHRCVLKIANFRYHGNRVGVIQILFAQLNSPTLKTLCFVQELGHISSTSKVIANFLLKFGKF